VKALVLGSGVIGVTTAYYLARDGHEVTVIDRHPEPANETTFANAGLVAPGHAFAWASPQAPKILLKSLVKGDQAFRLKPRLDPRMWSWIWLFLRECTEERTRFNTICKLRLCNYSLDALHGVVNETNVKYDCNVGGNLYLYRSQEAFDKGVDHMTILRDQGLQLEVANRDRIAELEPALEPVKQKIAGGIHSPTDESGDARMFTCALAQYCKEQKDVRFEFNTTIQALAINGEGISRVVTDKGDRSADLYVLSLGWGSPFVSKKIGIDLPIYPVKGYSVTVPIGQSNSAPRLGGVDEEHLVAFARFGDRLRITATAEFSGYDRSYKPADFRTMFKVARDLFPAGADYDQPTYWAGLRPMTPGTTPILGGTKYRNLYLNTGHGHIGWTMSCGSAKITADIIAGRKPDIDLTGLTLNS